MFVKEHIRIGRTRKYFSNTLNWSNLGFFIGIQLAPLLMIYIINRNLRKGKLDNAGQSLLIRKGSVRAFLMLSIILIIIPYVLANSGTSIPIPVPFLVALSIILVYYEIKPEDVLPKEFIVKIPEKYGTISRMPVLSTLIDKAIEKIACGGYATGDGLAAALAIGAGGVAMGSRFIASNDAEFHENYKNVIPPAKSQDTIVRTGGLGTIRLWKNKFSLAKGLVKTKEEKMAEEQSLRDHRTEISKEDLAEELRRDAIAGFAAYEGDVENGYVLLGQSISVINSVESVSDIIESVIKGAEKALKTAITYVA